jgi:2-polyprenyl-3-methyl-5-hydroxy-6-metoxy-1,4-benzoquinol methylase
MDIKEINKKQEALKIKYLESRIIDEEIVEKAIVFFNQYYNLVEHKFTREDMDKICNLDFSIKLDFLHWTAINPQNENDVNKFYRNTPFEFFKNLLKNMDIMHYIEIIDKVILPLLKKNNVKTVLDYGGGSGYQAILLHKLGYKITFSEMNKLSVEWMRYITKELNLNIEVIDLVESKIENNYDVIIFKDVLEHLVNPKPIINILQSKTKKLIIIPNKVERSEDYLPMHFPYSIE